MKFTKASFFCLLVGFVVLLTACPFSSDNEFYLYGKEIHNYPAWLVPDSYSSVSCEGCSEWMDWQSDEGKLLHSYVPASLISDEYSGKFRLLVDGQSVHLSFNDANQTRLRIFFFWVAEVTSCDNSIEIPQEDIENKFEYDGYLKTSLKEERTEENKSHIVMTRIPDESFEGNRFNYTLTVAGKELINLNLKNGSTESVFIDYSEHSWIPTIWGYLKWNSTLDSEKKYVSLGFWSCYEGISLRGEIDDEKQEISFNLLDAEQSGFADYFTLKVAEDKESAAITYYRLENGIPAVVRSDENLEF